ncbi:MAG: cobyrinate a,c-diamide synthase, partial [Eubacteriales bacterium]
MIKNCPRVLIAGTSSGSGKTTAVCAILTLLRRRGIAVTSCKCGPDYIDPMFHKSVLGVDCTNLDPFFCGDNLLRYLLCENSGEELTVIEGVMGYYDGTGSDGSENSTYTVARETTSPVILVVNAKGASTSLLPVIDGFLRFQPDSNIRGVIFNQISPMTYSSVKKLMKARFGDSVVPVGYIPKLPEDCVLGSRHLGLITAGEISDLNGKLNKIADLCESSIDIDMLMNIGRGAGALQCDEAVVPRFDKIRIAAALDSAFCFYYKDTLRLFEKMGAEIVPFSPLNNDSVPADAD